MSNDIEKKEFNTTWEAKIIEMAVSAASNLTSSNCDLSKTLSFKAAECERKQAAINEISKKYVNLGKEYEALKSLNQKDIEKAIEELKKKFKSPVEELKTTIADKKTLIKNYELTNQKLNDDLEEKTLKLLDLRTALDEIKAESKKELDAHILVIEQQKKEINNLRLEDINYDELMDKFKTLKGQMVAKDQIIKDLKKKKIPPCKKGPYLTLTKKEIDEEFERDFKKRFPNNNGDLTRSISTKSFIDGAQFVSKYLENCIAIDKELI